MVEEQAQTYESAESKAEKSLVVSVIVSRVNNNASGRQGGFIKEVNGRWYRASDRYSRERVGQQFRDLLHNQYKSSTKAKFAKKKHREEKNTQKSVSSHDESFSHRRSSGRIQVLDNPPSLVTMHPDSYIDDIGTTELPSQDSFALDTVDQQQVDPYRHLPNFMLENRNNEHDTDESLRSEDLEPLQAEISSSTTKEYEMNYQPDDSFVNSFLQENDSAMTNHIFSAPTHSATSNKD